MENLDLTRMLREKRHITIDIVGDSVTWGLNHCTAGETYTAQFCTMLAETYEDVSVYRYDGVSGGACCPMARFEAPVTVCARTGDRRIDVIRNGIGGNTVRRAIRRLSDFTGVLANGRRADITVFMFGINDALRSDPQKYVSPEVFAGDYRELLDRFRATETSQIVLMSATTNDQSIEDYVRQTERLAREEGCLYIDQYKVWQEHYDRRLPHFGYGDWLSDTPGDACHPTPRGAHAIAETLWRGLTGQR